MPYLSTLEQMEQNRSSIQGKEPRKPPEPKTGPSIIPSPRESESWHPKAAAGGSNPQSPRPELSTRPGAPQKPTSRSNQPPMGTGDFDSATASARGVCETQEPLLYPLQKGVGGHDPSKPPSRTSGPDIRSWNQGEWSKGAIEGESMERMQQEQTSGRSHAVLDLFSSPASELQRGNPPPWSEPVEGAEGRERQPGDLPASFGIVEDKVPASREANKEFQSIVAAGVGITEDMESENLSEDTLAFLGITNDSTTVSDGCRVESTSHKAGIPREGVQNAPTAEGETRRWRDAVGVGRLEEDPHPQAPAGKIPSGEPKRSGSDWTGEPPQHPSPPDTAVKVAARVAGGLPLGGLRKGEASVWGGFPNRSAAADVEAERIFKNQGPSKADWLPSTGALQQTESNTPAMLRPRSVSSESRSEPQVKFHSVMTRLLL